MPHTIAIEGALGAGKTTMACIMAQLYKGQVEKLGGSIELFSNFDMRGATPMDDYKDWYKVAAARGSICIWDEAHRVVDSRQALKHENILTSHLLTYARKMASIQIFVSPSINNLDTRVRQLTEVLIRVRKIGNKGISFDYFDYQAQSFGPYGKKLNSRFISASRIKRIHKLNLFDSHSMVGGFPLPKTERETAAFLAELEAIHNKARFTRVIPNEYDVDIETGEIIGEVMGA